VKEEERLSPSPSNGLSRTTDEEVLLVVSGDEALIAGRPGALESLLGELERREPGAGARHLSIAADSVALGTAAAPLLQGGSDLVRLTGRSLALLGEYGASASADGGIAAWVKGTGGTFAGSLSFERVAMGSAQLASVQLTMATLAIRLAIRQVEKAVERVEEAVDEVRLLVETERLGDVIGVYRALQGPIERLRSTGSSSGSDWSTVCHLNAEILGQVTSLRSYVEGRLKAATRASLRTRLASAEKFDDGRGVRTGLALLVVAEESLALWQELRLAYVAEAEPHRVQLMVASAREELNAQLRADRRLIEQLDALIRRLTDARAIEGLFPWRHDELDEARRGLAELRTWFANQRGIEVDLIEDVTRPGILDGARAVGLLVAGGTRAPRQAIGRGAARLRDRVRSVQTRTQGRRELSIPTDEPEEEMPLR